MTLGQAACSTTSKSSAPCPLPPPQGSQNPNVLSAALFCPKASVQARRVKIQFLVDDSGSMRGISPNLAKLVVWSEQASSYFRQVGISPAGGRACYFSSLRPLGACRTDAMDSRSFSGSGDTVLHRAIQSSPAFDLTMIITDGASAAGEEAGDCAGGVDPACVARALTATLLPVPGEPPGVRGGIWMVPLISDFNGTIFTEQYGNAEDITDADAAAVGAEMGQVARVSRPRKDRAGRLMYEYEGPRAFLVIILAKDLELGRTFVAALHARRSFAQIQALAEPGQFRGGIGALPAIEAYPGVAPKLEWTQIKRDNREAICGTVEARGKQGNISLTCSSAGSETNLYLESAKRSMTSDCVILRNLPSAKVEGGHRQTGPRIVQKWAWGGSAVDPTDPLRLGLRIRCLSDSTTPCGANAPRAQWDMVFDYGTSAGNLSQNSSEAAAAEVGALSAPSVIKAPHRIFQLRETLEKFYANVAALGKHKERIAAIEFCGTD